MALIAVICLFSNIPIIEAASNKILVVMSYEEDNPWCMQIKEGIDSVLAGNSDIKYFYMDTKKNIRVVSGRRKKPMNYINNSGLTVSSQQMITPRACLYCHI